MTGWYDAWVKIGEIKQISDAVKWNGFADAEINDGQST